MKNPFSKEPEFPVAVSVSEDDAEDKEEFKRNIIVPEGYFEYMAQKINPQAAEKWKEIVRDWQLGFYTKDDFQNLQFLFVHAMTAIGFKKTKEYGEKVMEMANYYSISTNSKDGFLRKQEVTRTKESLIKQQKNWKDRVKW